MNMLAGFEQPSAGSIVLNGAAISGPSRDRGVVFQGDDSLFSWLTALENIEFGLRLRGLPARQRRERGLHYLNLVGLSGQDAKYPAELSGGMKQRIQIARALANEPQILLMDEPFGALDAQTRQSMQEELALIWRETRTSVIFVTHDIDEAVLLATTVAVMTAGPGARLKAAIPVTLDGARDRTDPAFLDYYKRIAVMIREEASHGRRHSR